MNVSTLLYGMTLKESMVDKNVEDKEAEAIKKFISHYLKKKEVIY